MLRRPNLFYKSVLALLLTTTMATPIFADQSKPQTEQSQIQSQKQKVEVVFVLDTTGSMGGLIEGAKQKIWHVATEIQNAKTDVEVRMGLIAYRDRGDAYVTQHFPITNDINDIYANLIDFRAAGGGDHPESVNQALNEAVLQQNWSDDANSLKMIFLVGDAPPKMDYQDDVKYLKSVDMARAADINVNTILAGDDRSTKKVWLEIAQHGNGAFSQIKQDGNVTIVSTPFDDEIHQLNLELNDTVIAYGNKETQRKIAKKMKSVEMAAPAASSDMTAYNIASDSKGKVFSGEGDLVSDSIFGDVVYNSDDFDASALPKVMQKMSNEERKIYVAEKQKKRSEVQDKLVDLNKKRSTYKKEALKKQTSTQKNSLDQQLIDIIHKQAKAKNIKY